MLKTLVHSSCNAKQKPFIEVMAIQNSHEIRKPPLLGEAALREFIAAGSVTRIQALGVAGGFELRVDMGAATATLGSSRGGARLFSSLQTITTLLQRLEYPVFEVDATAYGPSRTRTKHAN